MENKTKTGFRMKTMLIADLDKSTWSRKLRNATESSHRSTIKFQKNQMVADDFAGKQK